MQFNNRDYLDNWQHPRLVVGPTQGGDFMIKHVHEDSCDFTLFFGGTQPATNTPQHHGHGTVKIILHEESVVSYFFYFFLILKPPIVIIQEFYVS